ncbi:ORF347 [White spot syndrome virus]|uniref:ORF347 n=1 Tax=White spot syndrome virus TaxID=342409 RepID=A0A2D3I6J3_9VIRU|nr:ORF347 [White spot syndrome virus]
MICRWRWRGRKKNIGRFELRRLMRWWWRWRRRRRRHQHRILVHDVSTFFSHFIVWRKSHDRWNRRWCYIV